MITNRELTAQDWHRLNGLLATALELEPPARVDWLAALPDDACDLKPLLAQLLSEADPTALRGTSETLQPVVQLAAAALSAMRHEQAGIASARGGSSGCWPKAAWGRCGSRSAPTASCSAPRRSSCRGPSGSTAG